MFGWFSAEVARASRRNLSMACAPGNDSLGRSFSATSRPNRASFARYTSPIPPAPSGATISYGPSFVPAFSTIEIVRLANNPHIDSSWLFLHQRRPVGYQRNIGRPGLAHWNRQQQALAVRRDPVKSVIVDNPG